MLHLVRLAACAVLLLVILHGLELLLSSLALDTFNDIVEGQDSKDGHTSLLANLADGAWSVGAVVRLALLLALAGGLLLSVEGNDDANELTTLALDDADGLSDGSAGSHDIVNDNNLLALEALANHQTTLAMVLDLLAVVNETEVAILGLVNASKLFSSGGAERDTLVGRAEEDVELELGVGGAILGDSTGVGLADAADELALGEQTTVEEVGRDTAGLEGEGAKGQDVGREGERDEVALVGGESFCGRHWWRRGSKADSKGMGKR
jgi:hypothetical protein